MVAQARNRATVDTPLQVQRFLDIQIVQNKIVPSKLPANGPYTDLFMANFKCDRSCSKCEELGAIVIEWDDILPMAKELKITERQFADKYCFLASGKRLMRQPCPFYIADTISCSIYTKQRPKACRLFPFTIVLCTDGLYHMGTYELCQAGVEFMHRFEEVIWQKPVEAA